jgi:phosphotransacetylase
LEPSFHILLSSNSTCLYRYDPETALNEDVRRAINPGSSLVENANLLVMPNPDVARIGYGLARRGLHK